MYDDDVARVAKAGKIPANTLDAFTMDFIVAATRRQQQRLEKAPRRKP